MKYVIVTGGVISGIGKGITASSIGLLLQGCGLTVAPVKIDPYLNVDAGTMSPEEHGECYVLDDGTEADLDLGNYERFLNTPLTSSNNITTGRVFASVIQAERRGHYLGKTVQVVPHVTDAILDRIRAVANEQVDVCLIELGGVVGDIESAPFVHALAQLLADGRAGNSACVHVHVTMGIQQATEFKTKPIQQSIRHARKLGLTPDIVVVRCPALLTDQTKRKLETCCQVAANCIVSNTNVPNIYYVPELFLAQGVLEHVQRALGLPVAQPFLPKYFELLQLCKSPAPALTVGIVAKYLGNPDTYLSLTRALEHAAFAHNATVQVQYIDACDTGTIEARLRECDAVVIPGGFGSRGISGKMAACQWCHLYNKPMLGICLGMQVMVGVAWQDAGRVGGSTEWVDEPQPDWAPIIDVLPGQTNQKGGTMRLGSYPAELVQGTRTQAAYGADVVMERHRHRYEVNPAYTDALFASTYLRMSAKGKVAVGRSFVSVIEAVEDSGHPFYVGVQFHPEYCTRYDQPHPLFLGLLSAATQPDSPV